jgi:hypothetical protein
VYSNCSRPSPHLCLFLRFVGTRVCRRRRAAGPGPGGQA